MICPYKEGINALFEDCASEAVHSQSTACLSEMKSLTASMSELIIESCVAKYGTSPLGTEMHVKITDRMKHASASSYNCIIALFRKVYRNCKG